MIPEETHLCIGSPLFEGMERIVLTKPFEVLSRLPKVTYPIHGRTAEPPFDSGTPVTGPAATPEAARHSVQAITTRRDATAPTHRGPAWRTPSRCIS